MSFKTKNLNGSVSKMESIPVFQSAEFEEIALFPEDKNFQQPTLEGKCDELAFKMPDLLDIIAENCPDFVVELPVDHVFGQTDMFPLVGQDYLY